MKKNLLIILCLIFVQVAYANNPVGLEHSLLLNSNTSSELKLNPNYQQFKFQVTNFETNNIVDYANLKKRRKNKSDNLMLYVAGGLAAATATLILVNDPDNFTSNSASGVNLGIATGGTVACGLIVTKFFLDRRR